MNNEMTTVQFDTNDKELEMKLPRNLAFNQLFLDENVDMLYEMISGTILTKMEAEQSIKFVDFAETSMWIALSQFMNDHEQKRFEVVWDQLLETSVEIAAYCDRQDEIDEQAEDDLEYCTMCGKDFHDCDC